MNNRPIELSRDSDLAGSLAAIRRAAKRARLLAAQTGTCLVVCHGEQFDRVPVTEQDTK